MERGEVRMVAFTRRVPAELREPATLRPYPGSDRTPTGTRFEFVVADGKVTELKQTNPPCEFRFARR